ISSSCFGDGFSGSAATSCSSTPALRAASSGTTIFFFAMVHDSFPSRAVRGKVPGSPSRTRDLMSPELLRACSGSSCQHELQRRLAGSDSRPGCISLPKAYVCLEPTLHGEGLEGHAAPTGKIPLAAVSFRGLDVS